MIAFVASMAVLAAFVSASPLANQDPRIVGGIPTTAEDYPFIVDLRLDWVQIFLDTMNGSTGNMTMDTTATPTTTMDTTTTTMVDTSTTMENTTTTPMNTTASARRLVDEPRRLQFNFSFDDLFNLTDLFANLTDLFEDLFQSELIIAAFAQNLTGCTIMNTSDGAWHCVSDSFCTGSLIQLEWPATILTAAHCLDDNPVAKYYGVFLGRTDADADYDANSNAYQYYANWRMSIHEDYNANNDTENDIALMFLNEDLSDDDSLGVVTLNDDSDLLSAGDNLLVMGYGLNASNGTATDTLEYVGQYFVNDSMCEMYFNSYFNTTNETLPDQDGMMCALGNGTDSCQGDSGGPLIVNGTSSDSWIQVGITSFGIGCASGTPGVYTDVSNYYDWVWEEMDEVTSTTTETPDDDGESGDGVEGYQVVIGMAMGAVAVMMK